MSCPDCITVRCDYHERPTKRSRYHSLLLGSARKWLRKLKIAEARLKLARSALRSAYAKARCDKPRGRERRALLVLAAKLEIRLALADVAQKQNAAWHCMRSILENK